MQSIAFIVAGKDAVPIVLIRRATYFKKQACQALCHHRCFLFAKFSLV